MSCIPSALSKFFNKRNWVAEAVVQKPTTTLSSKVTYLGRPWVPPRVHQSQPRTHMPTPSWCFLLWNLLTRSDALNGLRIPLPAFWVNNHAINLKKYLVAGFIFPPQLLMCYLTGCILHTAWFSHTACGKWNYSKIQCIPATERFPAHPNWSFVSGYWENCHSHWPTQFYFKRNEHFSSPFISKSRYGNLLKLLSLKV